MNANRRLARQVYIFASVVTALPVVILTIVDTFRYATPLAAERGTQWWWYPAIALPFWSVYSSYRGVRTLFEVVRRKARVWFLVLPAGFYVALIGATFAFGVLAALGIVSVRPDLDHPVSIDRQGFSFQHPGNWWVDEDADDYDPDYDLTIEPYQNAFVNIMLSDEPLDTKEAADSLLGDMQSVFSGGSVSAFDRWGTFSGVGSEYEGVFDGDRYRIRVFSTSTPLRTITVLELSEVSVLSDVEPGFALIRKSFRTKK